MAWSVFCWKGRRWSCVSLAEAAIRGMEPVQKPVQAQKRRPVPSDTDRRTSCTTLSCGNAPPGNRTPNLRIKSQALATGRYDEMQQSRGVSGVLSRI